MYSCTGGERFSFHVSFPKPCVLDVDDCSVDVGQDSIVLLLRKDSPEQDTAATTDSADIPQPWERCYVGLNASQTTVRALATFFLFDVDIILRRNCF